MTAQKQESKGNRSVDGTNINSIDVRTSPESVLRIVGHGVGFVQDNQLES